MKFLSEMKNGNQRSEIMEEFMRSYQAGEESGRNVASIAAAECGHQVRYI